MKGMGNGADTPRLSGQLDNTTESRDVIGPRWRPGQGDPSGGRPTRYPLPRPARRPPARPPTRSALPHTAAVTALPSCAGGARHTVRHTCI